MIPELGLRRKRRTKREGGESLHPGRRSGPAAVDGTDSEPIETSRLICLGESEARADELLAAVSTSEERSERDEAGFLDEYRTRRLWSS